MKLISKRDLNQQTASVLAAVSEGEVVTVTERGIPRWRIERIEGEGDVIERLEKQGLISPAAANPAPWPSFSPTYTPSEVDALLADERGDR